MHACIAAIAFFRAAKKKKKKKKKKNKKNNPKQYNKTNKKKRKKIFLKKKKKKKKKKKRDIGDTSSGRSYGYYSDFMLKRFQKSSSSWESVRAFRDNKDE